MKSTIFEDFGDYANQSEEAVSRIGVTASSFVSML